MDVITEFMNKNKNTIDKIALEYSQNYKGKGYLIIGGNMINNDLSNGKCFIEISKVNSISHQDRDCAKRWYFDNCTNGAIVASVANQLMENLK